MNDKLLEILANKVLESENKDVDIELFIRDICNTIIESLDLKEYVKDVQIQDSSSVNSKARGSIDNDGIMTIYKNGIEQDFADIIKKSSGLSEYEIKLYKFIHLLKTIIHELEHANQRKLVKEDKEESSIETFFINKSNSKDNPVFRFCLYQSLPTENMAELKANRSITKIVEFLELKVDIPLLSSYIKRQAMLEEFYNYYEYGLGGVASLFFKFFGDNIVEEINEKYNPQNLDLHDRLLYGLEISEDEYKQLVLKYAEYDKYIKSMTNQRKIK